MFGLKTVITSNILFHKKQFFNWYCSTFITSATFFVWRSYRRYRLHTVFQPFLPLTQSLNQVSLLLFSRLRKARKTFIEKLGWGIENERQTGEWLGLNGRQGALPFLVPGIYSTSSTSDDFYRLFLRAHPSDLQSISSYSWVNRGYIVLNHASKIL